MSITYTIFYENIGVELNYQTCNWISIVKKVSFIVFLILYSIFFIKGVRPVRAEDSIPLFPDKIKLKLGVSEDIVGIEETTLQKTLCGGDRFNFT